MKLSEPRLSTLPLSTAELTRAGDSASPGLDESRHRDPANDAFVSPPAYASVAKEVTSQPVSDIKNVVATFLTTLTVFGIYLFQGIIVARILGPLGRGEYGTALYFPRDVLLYAGLLGGIEIVNSYAVGSAINTRSLKYSAAKLGLISGILTGICAAVLSVIVLASVGKIYLVGYCLLCCLFVPWEHMQLTISAVDRGKGNYQFYNVNRLVFALAFPILVLAAFGMHLDQLIGVSPLLMMCGLSIVARMIGILPTLRGMDLWETFVQWWRRKRDSAMLDLNLNKTAADPLTLADSNATEADSIEVPGPFTLLKNGRWYALSMLASELFERLDIFLIVALATVIESGHYFVAVPAAALLTVMPNALAVFTFNYGADNSRRVSLKMAVGVMSITAFLQILAAMAFSLLIPYLILLFYKEDFAAAIPFALWLLPASAIKGFLQAADGYLKGRNKPLVGIKARILSIFVMLGFVALVYSGTIPGPEQKLLSIPMAACLGQALSMVIISTAVILDVMQRQDQDRQQDPHSSISSSDGLDGGTACH